MKTLELITHNPEEKKEVCELTRIPEVYKGLTGSCFRSSYFSEDGKKNCFGPLTMIFEIRTARDILTEGCDYQGLDIKIETGGRVLPALPAFSELQKLLDQADTIVHINGHIYKPNTEVYGFQQVYDDSVKCIDALKKIGFTNETMTIYATPNDISVEVSGTALGLEGNDELSSRYYKLLCYLANIKEVGGKPQKTDVKTILLDSVLTNGKILMPGSAHPTMKRVKVSVGASHFAYGIAAFSDTCGKKRSEEECIQEVLNWLKFLEKELQPVAGVRELLDKIPKVALPNKISKGAATQVTTAKTTEQSSENLQKAFVGVFQPLKEELESASNDFKDIPVGIQTFSLTLDKALGKGWATGGLHILLGNREKGKGSLLLQQAILTENKMPVLYISYEQNLKNFVTNTACLIGGINKSEMLTGLVGPNSKQIKMAFGAAVDKVQTKLSQNLYFSGIEAGRVKFDADEILQLADMLPEAPRRFVVIESLTEKDFDGNINAQLQKLKAFSLEKNLTILMSIHTDNAPVKRPNLIEESDLEYLSKYQRFSDTIVDLHSEKTNLRKFVALVKGQVDQTLVANLEPRLCSFLVGID
ncbi:MAG: hypothetical protein J6Z11_16400 [Candidatus Riflebacteria bacterium]|nr:hypothetical protein [Candidatus Riflebacteria bacterium]